MSLDREPITDPAGDRPITLLTLANVLLRRRRILAVVPAVISALGLLGALLQGTTYRARAKLTFEPSSPTVRFDLFDLAAQFGLVPFSAATDEGNLPFYRELVKTRDVLRAIVLSEYTVEIDAGGERPDTVVGNLVELYDVEGEDEEERIRAAMKILARNITLRDDPKSGLVILDTKADWPDLAVQLNRRVLEEIDEYNRERRKSRASEERRLVEERLRQVREELLAAERELEEFLARNRRGFEEAPQLMIMRNRLEREVEQKGQVYIVMFQAYEQARIAEVRENPLFTIVEPPEGSEEELRPNLFLVVLVSLFVGLFLAVGIVLVVEFVARQRALSPEEYEEFRSLWSATRRELRLDWLARRFRRAHDTMPTQSEGREEPRILEPHSSAGSRRP